MNNGEMNILFTSSGRRVALIRKFKEAYELSGIKGKIITADLQTTAPTAYFCDRHYVVPRVTDGNYVSTLLHICEAENIGLIVPLIDSELIMLALNRPLFASKNVKLLLSSWKLNEIAFDKMSTFRFFSERGIATPYVYSDIELAQRKYEFPLLIKPRNGSSSFGVYKIANVDELAFFRSYVPEAMVQEFIVGEEFTVDVMLDFTGRIRSIVPRLRLETRAGEVSKGVTKKDAAVIAAVRHVVAQLPGPMGCITIQCFKKADGEITFIEINPRFGGGVPLSIEAGANFPLWTLQLGLGLTFMEEDFNWVDGLTMLRFDDAVFPRGDVSLSSYVH